MEERRDRERVPHQGPGAFLQDGDICRIRLRDVAVSGVGAYVSHEFKPGLQGLLFTRLSDSDKVHELPSEVCWCMADPMAEDSFFPFRIGFRLMGDLTI